MNADDAGKLLTERRNWPTADFGAHEIHAATARLYMEQYGDWRGIDEHSIAELQSTKNMVGEMLEEIEKQRSWKQRVKRETKGKREI